MTMMNRLNQIGMNIQGAKSVLLPAFYAVFCAFLRPPVVC